MIHQIEALARQAGKMMLSFRDAAIHQKEGHFNFVTDADMEVQQYLRETLLSILPTARFF